MHKMLFFLNYTRLAMTSVEISSPVPMRISNQLIFGDFCFCRYTVVPVSGPIDLESCLVEHLEQVQHVVLINCGAAFDVVEAMQQSDDVTYYIIDRYTMRHYSDRISNSNLLA